MGVCFSSYFSDFRHAIEPVVRGAVFKPCLACPEKRSRHVHPALFINHLKTDKFTERHKSWVQQCRKTSFLLRSAAPFWSDHLVRSLGFSSVLLRFHESSLWFASLASQRHLCLYIHESRPSKTCLFLSLVSPLIYSIVFLHSENKVHTICDVFWYHGGISLMCLCSGSQLSDASDYRPVRSRPSPHTPENQPQGWNRYVAH